MSKQNDSQQNVEALRSERHGIIGWREIGLILSIGVALATTRALFLITPDDGVVWLYIASTLAVGANTSVIWVAIDIIVLRIKNER